MARFITAFAALPLVACFPAPLTDWPNHIARVWIGVRLLHHDPFWMRLYTLNPRLVPNLALDLGIGALHLAGLNIDLAAALFLLVSLIVFVWGFCRFARSMDAYDLTKPMLGATLFLTGPIMYGLVNYVLGIGIALACLGVWVQSADRPRRRWSVAIAATMILFPVHLLASAIFVLVTGCMDAWTWRLRWPRQSFQIVAASSSVGAGAAFLSLLLASPTGGDNFPHADGSNLWFPGHWRLFPTIWWKGGIFVRMFADHATIGSAVVTLIGIVVIASCVVAFRDSRGPLERSSMARGGAVLAIAVLLLSVLLLPESIGSGSLLDYRIALVPVTMAAAMIRLDAIRRAGKQIAFATVALVCLVRSLTFAVDFHSEQSVFRSIESAAARLPPGEMILSARGLADDDIPQRVWWSPPLEHGASRAVFAGQFVPTIFAVESQQPIVLRPEFDRWRRSWRIADQSEAETFEHDVAPLCGPAKQWPGKVLLFVAYPGRLGAANSPDVHLDRRWVLLNACRLDFGQK